MHVSQHSIPPLVEGPERGLIDILIGQLILNPTHASPATPTLHITWWGAVPDTEDIIDLNTNAQDQEKRFTIRYIFRSRYPHIQRYFSDMKTLPLRITDSPTTTGGSVLVGVAQLPVAELTHTRPFAMNLPVVDGDGQSIGTLSVSVVIHLPMYGGGGGGGAEASGVRAVPVGGVDSATGNVQKAGEQQQQGKTIQDLSGSPPPIETSIPTTSTLQHQQQPMTPDLPSTQQHQHTKSAATTTTTTASPLPPDSTTTSTGTTGTGCIVIHIESATNLPTTTTTTTTDSATIVASGNSTNPSIYHTFVSASWKSKRLKSSTPAAAAIHLPATGISAVWNSVLHFPADASDFIPLSSLSSPSSLTTATTPSVYSGVEGGTINNARDEEFDVNAKALLLLNVWQCDHSSLLTHNNTSTTTATTNTGGGMQVKPLDTLIGCAAIDLTELHSIITTTNTTTSSIHGDFPVVDYIENIKGRLRVKISMDDVLHRQMIHLVSGGGAGVSRGGIRDSTRGVDTTSTAAAAAAATKEKETGVVVGEDRWKAMNAALASLQLSVEQQTNPTTTSQASQQHQNHHQKQQQQLKQRTAWSGSDSDWEDEAMVGVAFNGAISSGGEDDSDDDDDDVYKFDRLTAGADIPRGKPVITLDDDWMFGITANVTPTQLSTMTVEVEESFIHHVTEITGGGDGTNASDGVTEAPLLRNNTTNTSNNSCETGGVGVGNSSGFKFRNRLPRATTTSSNEPSIPSYTSPPTNTSQQHHDDTEHGVVYKPPQALPTLELNPTARRSSSGGGGGSNVNAARSFLLGGGGLSSEAQDWLFGLEKKSPPRSGGGSRTDSGTNGGLGQFMPMGDNGDQ